MITEKIIKNYCYFYEKGEITNEQSLDICKAVFDYLDPVPVAEFAKEHGISRQGVYSSVYKDRIVEVLGKHYVLNNI